MKRITKTFWPLATLSLLMGSSLLNASDEAQIRNLENRVCALETSKNCCCVINPPARPFNSDCWGLFITVDPLVWQGHENGLGLAIKTTDGTELISSTGVGGQARVQNLNFNWDWGFRLGLGLNTTHDAWDILLQWTRWYSSASKSVSASDNSALYPIRNHPLSAENGLAQSASGDLDLSLNMLDLENGREFYVSRCLTIRPHAGLRTAWFKQELDIKYDNVSPSPSATNGSILPRQEIDAGVRYWGLGIRGGVDLQWNLFPMWSIFSNYAGSVMYNYYSRSHKENAVDAEGNKSVILNVGDFYHIGSMIQDAQIGIRFDWISCDECYHVGLDLGWEHHFFPGQNQFFNFTDNGAQGNFTGNDGDFATQGYFLKVRFDF